MITNRKKRYNIREIILVCSRNTSQSFVKGFISIERDIKSRCKCLVITTQPRIPLSGTRREKNKQKNNADKYLRLLNHKMNVFWHADDADLADKRRFIS